MTDAAVHERFALRQKITMMVNRYEIRAVDAHGQEGELVAVAQQKRMAFKEHVTFYADKDRTQPVFTFRARKRVDLGATYDVLDADGAPIGWFRKDFGKSLLRSSWHLGTNDGLEAFGEERNPTVAVIRRIWSFIPFIGDIPLPFIFHFDFKAGDGTVVMSSEKKVALRDRYDIRMPRAESGWQVDWRVGLAMAVALDALQAR